MDIKQLAEYKEVLENIQDLYTLIAKPPPENKYRVYNLNRTYFLETYPNGKSIMQRTHWRDFLRVLKKQGISTRDVIFDL